MSSNASAKLRPRIISLLHQEIALIVGLLITVLCVWAFVEIAGEVTEGDSRSFDVWVIKSLRQKSDPAEPIGPHWMKTVGLDITALGGTTVLVLLILMVAAYLFLARKPHAMTLVLVAALGGQIMSSIMKSSFGRERPDIVPHLSEVQTSSFPSGHSMMSTVVYLTLGTLLAQIATRRREKIFLLGSAILLSVLVGLSRVYLGVHYPTDVLAGWSAGLAWAVLCWAVAHRMRRKGQLERSLTE